MRLNKRLIKNAPKRGPKELEIELSKIKTIETSYEYQITKIRRDFIIAATDIHNSMIEIGNELYKTLKPYTDALNIIEK